MAARFASAPTTRWEFDSAALARAMVLGRRRLGLSSRDLARGAGISQAYVVRLERASHPGAHPRPTPTVDVLARLADTLLLDPGALMAGTLRRAGRHVLLITDGSAVDPLAHARNAAGAPVDTWISVSSDPQSHPDSGVAHRSVVLCRGGSRAYDPRVIVDSLRHEVHALADDLNGQNVGLIFPEVSHVMQTLDDPATVIQFEHRWADVVSAAVSAVGAHAAWNVCVYDIEALRGLPDPVLSAVDLMGSHDTIWSVKGARVAAGAPAARRILEGLRPQDQTAATWLTTANRLIDDLGFVA